MVGEVTQKAVPWIRNIWDLPGLDAHSEEKLYLIRLFIVTYNSPETVNKNLQSLLLCECPEDVRIQINIINNHPNFYLDPEFHGKVIVHDNSLRLKTSIGHLARDYNSALMLGFEDLEAPKCHQVIITHDDVIWHKDAVIKLFAIHYDQGYSFYTGNFGCSFMSFLPDVVRTVGLFDERFCNIGFHEADYFLRALIYYREKSSINDDTHGRVVNPTEILFDHPPYTPNKVDSREISSKYHSISRGIFSDKWNVYPDRWKENGILDSPPIAPLIDSYLYYPRFELGMNYDVAIKQRYRVDIAYKYHWYDSFAMEKNVILTNWAALRWNARLTPDQSQIIDRITEYTPAWNWNSEDNILKGKINHDLVDIEDKIIEGGPLEWLTQPPT